MKLINKKFKKQCKNIIKFQKYNLSIYASQVFDVKAWSNLKGVKMDKEGNILLHTLNYPDQKIFCGLESLGSTLDALIEVK